MNVEERVLIVLEHLAVEGLVLLFGALRRVFQPQGMRVIDGLFFLSLFLLLTHLREVNFHRHEGAVFFQNFEDPVSVQEFGSLFA